ncbi:hypothetical protein BJA01nite_79770 [Bradyrhizobium japonicum]|nr:hypothetical protein BJA01nite_79770 [Bradyrhizobium japonicum]
MRDIKHRHLEEKSFAAGRAAKQWSAKETEQGVPRAERSDYVDACAAGRRTVV